MQHSIDAVMSAARWFDRRVADHYAGDMPFDFELARDKINEAFQGLRTLSSVVDRGFLRPPAPDGIY